MCIQVLRMDSSKGIPFCGLDVAASKGYFCSVQPGAAWGQAPGGQGGRGAGSVQNSPYSEFTASFYAWERCFIDKNDVLIFLIVLYIY